MTNVATSPDLYLADFETLARQRAAREPEWLRDLRRAAMDRFTSEGFPSTRLEEWRFTNVAPIAERALPRASSEAAEAPDSADVSRFALTGVPGSRLVFIDGRFAPALSSPTDGKRLIAGSLSQLLETDPGLLDRHLTRQVRTAQHGFTALNTALFEDGAVVHVPANQVVEEPIHLLHLAGDGCAAHPRTLVVAGENSQVRIVESYVAWREGDHFTNAVTEIVGGPGSTIDHYRVQQESLRAFHVSSTHVTLARSATFTSHSIVLGGALVRNDVNALLDAEGICCTLNGLYLVDGRRLIDNHTAIDHAKPHCESHEIYKGILDGHGRGVFNGKIFVRQDAQKTDAKQTNQVLLLSDDATINTKPQLEIFADDVKCTHGATVGQLDENALFYLRARGIGRDEARAMLIHAFAEDIVERIAIASLRDDLERVLLTRLPHGPDER